MPLTGGGGMQAEESSQVAEVMGQEGDAGVIRNVGSGVVVLIEGE